MGGISWRHSWFPEVEPCCSVSLVFRVCVRWFSSWESPSFIHKPLCVRSLGAVWRSCSHGSDGCVWSRIILIVNRSKWFIRSSLHTCVMHQKPVPGRWIHVRHYMKQLSHFSSGFRSHQAASADLGVRIMFEFIIIMGTYYFIIA